MRHSANPRMYARGRPHNLHRFFFRVEYFGSRFALTIIEIFAMATHAPERTIISSSRGRCPSLP
jgi:hypothetical protein